MRKYALKAVIFLAVIAATVVLLISCTGENYKTDAVSTQGFNNSEISSNGGLAVKAGKYLYFVNGYAGKAVTNDFGEVVKGGIYRVDLINDVPDYSTATAIVKKNVYAETASAGLWIVDGYIYYTTPSVLLNKDKDKGYKADSCDLMRVKVDGTGTEVVHNFDDFAPKYTITQDGYVVYMDGTDLRRININSKKLDDSLIVEEVSSSAVFFTTVDGIDPINNLIIYATAQNDDKSDTSTRIVAYIPGSNKSVDVIKGKESYKDDTSAMAPVKGYTLTVVGVYRIGTKIRIAYTKTAISDSFSSVNAAGTYYYDFDDTNFAAETTKFNYSKEKKFSTVAITALKFTKDNDDNDIIFATADSALVVLTYDSQNDVWEKSAALIPASPTIVAVDEKADADNNIAVYYIATSKLYKQVISLNDKKVPNLSTLLFSATYASSWLTIEKIGNTVYFFNDKVANYTYYQVLDDSINGIDEPEALLPQLLSVLAPGDSVALIAG